MILHISLKFFRAECVEAIVRFQQCPSQRAQCATLQHHPFDRLFWDGPIEDAPRRNFLHSFLIVECRVRVNAGHKT